MIAVTPPRPPPPTVTTPMTGEPSVAQLGEARLETSSCEDLDAIEKKRVASQIRQMRADVDAAYHDWAAEQPSCWEEYRWRARANHGYAWGASIGEAYGYGGLGLSGVGRGGGGTGYGVGYGSVGSIGHGSGTAGGTVRTAHSVSKTNNQVAGVDEADIVKSDGRYVYLAMNGALRIVEALKPHVVSTTRLPGAAREMFVEGDRAVVYTSSAAAPPKCTYGYDCQFAGDGTSTRVLVFDVSNRAAPKKVREIDLSGSLMAARRIGNAVHTVVADNDAPRVPVYQRWPTALPMCGVRESVVRAKLAQLKRENEKAIRARHASLPTIRDAGVEKPLCKGLLRTAFSDGEAFTTLVELRHDRTTPRPPLPRPSRAGPAPCSRPGTRSTSSVTHQRRNRWYSFYSSVNEASEIHKFRIGASPRETSYVGSGVVPGHVLNQFSMDEWYGYLRIATTKGRVPDPKAESVVSILAEGQGGNLARVGAVDKIAPGEDIRAVRFDGDRGYVVTFKKTDPLFVLDLYHPAAPSILGELKIPGFSTYLHRIDPDHLLAIGFDANDHGDFAYFDGVILQLFDVHKPTEPKLMFREKIGTRGSSSAAATDHLAFNYFADKGLLAIPMTICEGGSDGQNGNEMTFSGLLVYNVSLDSGFKRLGGIDHGAKGVGCGTWWSNATSAVKRSLFVDDLVYSIAADRLKVQRLGHFGSDVADIALGG